MDDSRSSASREGYWQFVGRLAPRDGADGGRAGAPAGGPPAPGRPRGYLEQSGKAVTEGGEDERRGEEREEGIEVRACGCRSRFCPHCCLPTGLALKRRLEPELAKFTGLMMLTFTIDPQLFETPAEAFAYVRDRRCIAVTVQRLHRWGLLHSRRFVSVVEWQRHTEQAHWHVLVDATFIPFDKLCEAWNRNWRGWRQRVEAGRPGLGSVRFSVPKFADARKAVGYVTAYLVKHPEHGFPSWVLDSKEQVHRFSTSRGFWTCEEGQAACEEEGRGTGGEEEEEDEAREPQRRDARTIRERVATCGTTCAVFRVGEGVDERTGEVTEVRSFAMRLPVPMSAVLPLAALGVLGAGHVNPRMTAATFRGPGVLRRLLAKLGMTNNKMNSSMNEHLKEAGCGT